MERILVISDTHGNIDLLKKVLVQESNCTSIFHLGDNYEDLDNFTDLSSKKTILKVPGIFHPEYRNGLLPAIQYYKIIDWNLLLVHDLNDATTKVRDSDVYLHGHTHKADLITKFGKIFFNPGHLKQKRDRGYTASYGILEIEKKSINFIVKDINNNVIINKLIDK